MLRLIMISQGQLTVFYFRGPQPPGQGPVQGRGTF